MLPLTQYSSTNRLFSELRTSRFSEGQPRGCTTLNCANGRKRSKKLEDTKTDVGWGHQIRSYVLDNSRIKDLRTNFGTSATQEVLDEDLDQFIQAGLKQDV